MEHRVTDFLGHDEPLVLDSGFTLEKYKIAYNTYGTLSEEGDNAILICHALTGDQYVASMNPETKRPGWWTDVVGPDCAIDTTKYFIVCSNVLGGCMGSTGPSAINEATGRRWGLKFPVITIGDMVKAQAELIKYLHIKKILAVVGGSMGGMQVLEWLRMFPNFIKSVIIIASSCRQHVQNVAFHEAGRQAIMRDPKWANGDYLETGVFPNGGLSIARMIAHITYLSPQSLHEKFGRRLQERNQKSFEFLPDFKVESYLHHQGQAFTERFDPNSYLYITRAVDYLDQSERSAGNLSEVYEQCLKGTKLCVGLISFNSDWMYPTNDSIEIENALIAAGVAVERHELKTEDGHDSFLLKNKEMECIIHKFIKRISCEID